MGSSGAAAIALDAPVSRERVERMFYLVAACLLLLIVALGFQQFYLHGKAPGGGQITRPIVPLVFLHGIAMSSWIVLLAVQSGLIVSGNRRLHISLGVAGSALAALSGNTWDGDGDYVRPLQS